MDEKENEKLQNDTAQSQEDTSQNDITYNLEDMTQIICPDCGQSTVVNVKTVKKPYCSNPTCGRSLNIPKPSKKDEE